MKKQIKNLTEKELRQEIRAVLPNGFKVEAYHYTVLESHGVDFFIIDKNSHSEQWDKYYTRGMPAILAFFAIFTSQNFDPEKASIAELIYGGEVIDLYNIKWLSQIEEIVATLEKKFSGLDITVKIPPRRG